MVQRRGPAIRRHFGHAAVRSDRAGTGRRSGLFGPVARPSRARRTPR